MRISRPLRDWSSCPIVPSTGSALYLCSHPVQLVCAEPYWAMIRSSLRDFALQTAVATPGLERNAPRTGLCAGDPALDQQSANRPRCPICRPVDPVRAGGPDTLYQGNGQCSSTSTADYSVLTGYSFGSQTSSCPLGEGNPILTALALG